MSTFMIDVKKPVTDDFVKCKLNEYQKLGRFDACLECGVITNGIAVFVGDEGMNLCGQPKDNSLQRLIFYAICPSCWESTTESVEETLVRYFN